MIRAQQLVSWEGISCLDGVVAVTEHEAPDQVEEAVCTFVNFVVVEEKVLIDEVVKDGDEIDYCEWHLNLVNWVEYSTLSEDLVKEENIEHNSSENNWYSYSPPHIVRTLLYI